MTQAAFTGTNLTLVVPQRKAMQPEDGCSTNGLRKTV